MKIVYPTLIELQASEFASSQANYLVSSKALIQTSKPIQFFIGLS
jgi:hypothetical protein